VATLEPANPSIQKPVEGSMNWLKFFIVNSSLMARHDCFLHAVVCIHGRDCMEKAGIRFV